jgi:hypothetical protein
MIKPDELTLSDVESAVGYTVGQAIAEYRANDYGDWNDWTAESIANAELEGDTGDKIRENFKGELRDRAAALWTERIKEIC